MTSLLPSGFGYRSVLAGARRLLRFTGSTVREHDDGVRFGVRLLVSFALTLGLVGLGGYVLMARQLRTSVISGYVDAHTADAASFEIKGAQARARKGVALREIGQAMVTINHRPGTLRVLLVDSGGIVRTAGALGLVGSRVLDPEIAAAIDSGHRYAGRNTAVGSDPRDFELVAPVQLPSGRYAYVLVYDHEALDAQLADLRWVLSSVGLLALLAGGGVFYLVGGRSLMRSHRMALQRATRDGLTDLPNQRAFQEDLPEAVETAQRQRKPLALVLLDVDDFKFINDRHGHPHGDALLERLAAVLREGRSGDRVYRLGGDEFAVLMPHTDVDGARVLGRRLARQLGDASLQVSAGVSVQRPGQPADDLRAEADAALYEAKRRGGHQIVHFADIEGRVVVTTTDKRVAVRRLIDEGRLTTVLQPVWDLAGGTLLGVEALSRLDSRYGLAGPGEAFDIAEQIGRVHELDVLCVDGALSRAEDLPEGTLLFVNLRPQTLDLDADRNDWLRLAVQSAGLPLDRVVVEVTERFGGRTAAVVKCLVRLRAQGFKIAVDDVGTGNAGIEFLQKVHPNFVKLDRNIVRAAMTEPGARAVLLAMATFARQTDAFVVAEGIEDEETLEFVRHIDGIDLHPGRIVQGGQGFVLGAPSVSVPTEPPAVLGDGRAAA